MTIANKKFLIVDDSVEMLDVVSGILNELGVIDIHRCLSGEDAIEEIKANGKNYDCVLSDQNMDEMSGVDLLKATRKIFTKEELPFVMLTSEGSKKNVILVISNGGNNFLVKPPSKETMLEKLEGVF